MPGTAGNLSARDDDGHFWITASGKAKGRLRERDFLLIAVGDGAIRERMQAADKPSAETAIHRSVYRSFPEARACLHVHSVDACLAAARAPSSAGALALPPLEMLKGFDIWEQAPQVDLPLFANLLDVSAIAEDIEARFRAQPPALSALMIRDHGITVWGTSIEQAYNRVECLEFLLSYLARGASS